MGRLLPDTPPVTLTKFLKLIEEIVPMKSHLDVFSVTVSVLIRILQLECLKVDPDLWTNLIIQSAI